MKLTPETNKFAVGGSIDPATSEETGNQIDVKASDLTTHGVIVGMTGSGKTGLGMIMAEEALCNNIPVLALDPKGDLGNLCLTFPNFSPSDFEPWIDSEAATADGKTSSQAAQEAADLWKGGLESWGIGKDRMNALSAVEKTIYTPGATHGVPLDFLGNMAAPAAGTDPEVVAEEVESTASSLLELIGIDSDPLSGPEHILLSNIISHCWSENKSIGVADLVFLVQDVPFRKLGVIELDEFYPPNERKKLAMALNGLVASTSFRAWSQGIDLDIESMLRTPDGRAKAAVISMTHLSDTDRQAASAMVLSKLISWMRSQQGTSELRAMVYIDEVMGMAPPSSNPATKKPILTLMKQARAFGVGVILSTQNPVDLDYKAISNAGTWMVGRLQTEQDKARLTDGLRSADGSTNVEQAEATISALGKRQFLLRSAKTSALSVFTTRWAMSYLAGPLSSSQTQLLMAAKTEAALEHTGTSDVNATSKSPTDDSSSSVPPDLPDNLSHRYVTPSAPWLTNVAGLRRSASLTPVIAARIEMLFDDSKADLRETQEWEAIVPLGVDDFESNNIMNVDFDDRDFETEYRSPSPAQYGLPEFNLTKTRVTQLERDLKATVYSNELLTLLTNKKLKLWSRPDETPDAFVARCTDAADDKADEESAKIRDRLEARKDRLEAALAKAEDRVSVLESQKSGSRVDQAMTIGKGILGSLLGGGSRTRGLATTARQITRANSRGSTTKARLESAENRVTEKLDDIEELETELAEAVIEIQDKWDEVAAEVEEVDISLEKTDIRVTAMYLAWLPPT